MASTEKFETAAIHAGQAPDLQTGAVVPPVHRASTFKQDGVGHLRDGYEYARSDNPTRRALEANLAALESVSLDAATKKDVRGFAFASGLAAEDNLMRAFLKPDSHLVISIDAYGGTTRLAKKVLPKWGVSHTALDLQDLAALENLLIEKKTDLVWVETPTNPTLRIIDIAAVSKIAHAHGALVVVDNTFASPYLQQPLALGADFVLHSTTKYLGGHSDVIGGAVITKTKEHAEEIKFLQNASGAVPGPDDCYLVLRGTKTLAVRVQRHCENAKAVAEFLTEHPQVAEVFWPGLTTHPNHEVAKRQMRDFGGMVSFRHSGGANAAAAMAGATEVFTLAESLGGVESLIEVPAAMTHASVADTESAVPPDLVRLSVGIEHIDDLLVDLDKALAG
jgi:cystathionine gamma-synthase